MESPLPDTKKHSVRHYMWCKEREYGLQTNKDSILKILHDAKKFETVLGLETTAHCKVWRKLLS